MRARQWLSGTVLAFALLFASSPAEAQGVGERASPDRSGVVPPPKVWDSAIAYVALVSLLGIEIGVVSRGFAKPDHSSADLEA